MQDFQELADEAFRDLLEKHGRPTDLKTALRRSVENNPVIKAGRRSIGWRGSTSAFSRELVSQHRCLEAATRQALIGAT